MAPALTLHLVEAAAAALLLVPLIRLTQLSYDRQWWWSLNEIDLLPFPAPWTMRSPLWAWFLLFWSFTVYGVVTAFAQGSAARLAIIVAGIEAGYTLLRWGKRMTPVDPSFPGSILAFGLWHNAVSEELIFRGILLLIGTIAGLSALAFWPYVFIPVTAFAFGFHHYRLGGQKRFYDTTLFGALLGAVALHYGLAAAVLLHSIHNARSLPLGHSDPTLRLWQRNRNLYVAGLTLIGVLRFVL